MAYTPIPKKLTPGDKEFIKLTENGEKRSTAFKKSYPDHPLVVQFHETDPGSPAHQQAAEGIKQAAKFKLQAKYIRKASDTYHDRMMFFSDLSVETAIDLVQHAKSEKVRADLATEGMRQRVGAPTTKVQVQEEKTVVLTFGPAPHANAVEGVVVPRVPSEPRDKTGTDTDVTSLLTSPSEPSPPHEKFDY